MSLQAPLISPAPVKGARDARGKGILALNAFDPSNVSAMDAGLRARCRSAAFVRSFRFGAVLSAAAPDGARGRRLDVLTPKPALS